MNFSSISRMMALYDAFVTRRLGIVH